MNWTKLLYVLIIVLLYVPMVFLGANVFFPKYTGTDSYYQGPDCYSKYPYPSTELERMSKKLDLLDPGCFGEDYHSGAILKYKGSHKRTILFMHLFSQKLVKILEII